ncbi:MAG: hypothetical protein OEV88_15740, partial [Gammaproteobacteria bacterium]|nr:hypothetical protein [Gammaproteobacteria bacterium]
ASSILRDKVIPVLSLGDDCHAQREAIKEKIRLMDSSMQGRDRGEAPRKNQVALGAANKSGAFCEQSLPRFSGTVRVPKIAQQFWSSCAAATFVCGAAAFSRGFSPVVPNSKAEIQC